MDCPELEFQPVGGHEEVFSASPDSATDVGGPSFIRKRARPREAAFYAQIGKLTSENGPNLADPTTTAKLESVLRLSQEDLQTLRPMLVYIPYCVRITSLPQDPAGASHEYEIEFENITRSFKWPCVMDVKIGTEYHTYYTETVKAEDLKRRAKLCTTANLGLRLTGLRGRDHKTGEVTSVPREVGRKMKTREELLEEINKYLDLVDPKQHLQLVTTFLDLITFYKKWFSAQTSFTFRQSSLLFAFDSHPSSIQQNVQPVVSLIDFSHIVVNEAEGQPRAVDEGFLFGISHLKSLFQEILSNSQIYAEKNAVS